MWEVRRACSSWCLRLGAHHCVEAIFVHAACQPTALCQVKMQREEI